MCMPLGDYLKDFNTLYMSYCIRGFLSGWEGALTRGLTHWQHPHMWCYKTDLLTSPVSLILARPTCLVFLAVLLPPICSKVWPSYHFIADSYLYYLLRFHLKLIILSFPVYEDTVTLAFCEYSPIADYIPMVYFIFCFDIISDLEKLQEQYKEFPYILYLDFSNVFATFCFSEPFRVSCRHGVPLFLNSLMCAS